MFWGKKRGNNLSVWSKFHGNANIKRFLCTCLHVADTRLTVGVIKTCCLLDQLTIYLKLKCYCKYLKGRKVRVYKFSRKQNFPRINFRDWRFQLFRGNLFSRISRMKKFLCISRGEIFANFASRRFFKLWRKLIFELRPSHIRPRRRGHISFWLSYHTITSSECSYHQ